MLSILRSYFRKRDPVLFKLLESISLEVISPRKPNTYFESLCREIIGQQLSGRVAEVIYARFEQLFPKKSVTVKVVQTISDESLRKTGMAWSKVRYIRDLSLKVCNNHIDLGSLTHLPDEQVMRTLTQIKGIGPWTAEMFCIFTLGREDVFSYGDLGLRRAIQKLYGFKKEPTAKQMEKIVLQWKPYRSYAARLLWNYLDNQ